ncbi:MAG: bifunctional 4-hydroxy-2-oxoglutarate aldolase/2-dehydro-3-deoxy-phosphogluconate aldolase [Trueperaceae bacterium]
MQSTVLELISRTRLVAIIRLDDLSQAVQLSKALLAGGIVAQEFTLSNPKALDALAEVKAALSEFSSGGATIGLGSVRNVDEAHAAIKAGAQFVVTPITKLEVIETCKNAGIPIMPGAYTPTEIAAAHDAGADVVKVFPARTLGPNYLKDVLAPMPYLKLMPTGGVDLENMANFFKAGAMSVGVGGNLLDKEALQRNNWEKIASIAKHYADAARG